LERWPKQGLMLSGRVFRQQMWVPAIGVIGGGVLPTPRAQEPNGTNHGYGDSVKERVCLEIGLPTKKYPLPTPRTCSAMASRLDTPGNLESERFPNLETVIARMLPTPTTNDSKNASLPPSQQDRNGLAGAMLRNDSIPTGAATYLNPSFVEEMMGYPVGYTA
jgi:hypothetical protein